MTHPLIIGEVSCNHLGSLARALQIIEATAQSGADAVKFQCWSPGTMCVSDYVVERGAWTGRRLRDLYEECFTPWEWFPTMFDLARTRGLVPFASAFDAKAVDFLETLACPIYKIASYEITDLPLIEKVSATHRPLMISTGAGNYDEINAAVVKAQAAGASNITLLKCTSSYPAPVEEANLATMDAMRRRWHTDVGLSDHTLGIGVAVAAATLRADVIEKHLTLSRADGGPDAGFSMEPDEFKAMVRACRQAAEAVGSVSYEGTHDKLRRSLWIARDVPHGSALQRADICSARPELGMPARDLEAFIGRIAASDILAGTPLTWDLVDYVP